MPLLDQDPIDPEIAAYEELRALVRGEVNGVHGAGGDARKNRKAEVRKAPRDAAKYGNLIGIPLLLAVFGTTRLWRRRRLSRRVYEPLAPSRAA